MIKVFKLTETAKLPTKAEGDMCYDVYADEDASVQFGKVAKIKTGIKIAPPENYHYSVRDRSGMAAKNGLHVVAGQIDNSYRGELIVCLTSIEFRIPIRNDPKLDELKKNPWFRDAIFNYIEIKDDYQIKKGDKIAQIKFEKDTTFPVVEVKSEEELGATERSDKGFGSSGR